MVKSEWIAKGFADEPVENKEQLVEMILQLKREKNAVILGHYYQRSEIQDIADFVGDSLAMAQWAAKVEADVLVVCGVHFMGETAKILCPDKMAVFLQHVLYLIEYVTHLDAQSLAFLTSCNDTPVVVT